MGYLHDLIAVRARYRRNRAAWAPHLTATREHVAAAIEAAPGRDLAVVLGAGLLLDVPLDALSAAFKRVVLVDICWLGETRRACRRYGNVDLLDHDITGIATACHKATAIPTVPRGAIPYLRDARSDLFGKLSEPASVESPAGTGVAARRDGRLS